MVLLLRACHQGQKKHTNVSATPKPQGFVGWSLGQVWKYSVGDKATNWGESPRVVVRHVSENCSWYLAPYGQIAHVGT